MGEKKLMLPQVLPLMILLQNMETKSPDYVMEKVSICYKLGDIAFRLLDQPNSAKLLQWLETWGMKEIYPESKLKEIEAQATDLGL
jgi:hypothetical protein